MAQFQAQSQAQFQAQSQAQSQAQFQAQSQAQALASPIKHLLKYKNTGVEYLNKLSEKRLGNMLLYSNQMYYEGSYDDVESNENVELNKNNIILTDDEYDMLREHTLKMYPKNKIALEGHMSCDVDVKVKGDRKKAKLPCFMGSMDKIKDKNSIDKYLSKYSENTKIVSAKLDGVSGLYCYCVDGVDGVDGVNGVDGVDGVNGVDGDCKMKLYTRGNGSVGQDITYLIKHFRLPKLTHYGIIIRGEFVMKKAVFEEKYSDNAANPRNFVSGIINSKHIHPKILKDIDFVVYEIVNPIVKPDSQMKAIKKLKFNTVLWNCLNSKDINVDNLSKILMYWRKEYDYEIDGIICTDNDIYKRKNGNPEHSFAFKMILNEQIAETNVIDIIWNPSKDGLLKPIVQIEPVNLSGAEINYVTGVNAKNIIDKGLGFGARVLIIRSGDVIPDIHKVIIPASKPTLPNLPEESYEWNETHVDFKLKNLNNNKEVQIKIIAKFFKTLEVEGIGEGNVKRIVNAGYDSISKILAMSYENIFNIEGFKEKSSTKIYKNIHEGIKNATLCKLMVATNIFGRGFGIHRIYSILERYPNILIDKNNDDIKIKKLSSACNGIANKTAKDFTSKINKFIEWINENNLQYKLFENNSSSECGNGQIVPEHPLSNINYVMSGARHKDLIKKLTEIGAKQNSSVNKSTNYLLVDSLDNNSSKIVKAKQLEINIMTYNDFIKKYSL
jgi:DNA ligase (NAD+)